MYSPLPHVSHFLGIFAIWSCSAAYPTPYPTSSELLLTARLHSSPSLLRCHCRYLAFGGNVLFLCDGQLMVAGVERTNWRKSVCNKEIYLRLAGFIFPQKYSLLVIFLYSKWLVFIFSPSVLNTKHDKPSCCHLFFFFPNFFNLPVS